MKSLQEQISEGAMMSRKNVKKIGKSKTQPEVATKRLGKSRMELAEEYIDYLSAREAEKAKRVERIQGYLRDKRGFKNKMAED